MPKRNECVFGGCSGFFRCQPSEVRKEQRLNYIAYRTDDGKNTGKIRFYCKALEVSRQAFYDYLKRKKKPLCIPTAAASIPVLHIGQSLKNMALCRA